MKALKNYVPILLLLATFAIPPMLLPHVLASSAGLLVIGNLDYQGMLAKFSWVPNDSTHVDRFFREPLQVQPLAKTIFVLERGIVSFETINGKLISRYVKAS